MRYIKGSSIAVGLVLGTVIGLLTDNLASMALLGLMFGLIGEWGMKKKQDPNQ